LFGVPNGCSGCVIQNDIVCCINPEASKLHSVAYNLTAIARNSMKTSLESSMPWRLGIEDFRMPLINGMQNAHNSRIGFMKPLTMTVENSITPLQFVSW